MLKFLYLVALNILGTFAPTVPEALSIAYTANNWNIWIVATGIAMGQCVAYTGLYFFGEQLMIRWKWLAQQVYEVKRKFADHLESRFLVLSAVGGSVGIPPAVALATLASGFDVPARHLIPLLFVMRILRFAVIGSVLARMYDWLRTLV